MSQEKDPLSLEAWAAHHHGENDEAIEKFNKILARNPMNDDALNGLALSQKAVGDHLGARVTLNKLVQLLENRLENDPDNYTRYVMEIRMARQQLDMLDV